MKAIVISDLHGDQSTAGVDRFEDVHRALATATDYAIDHEVDAFFFLGDLADPNTTRVHRSLDMLGGAIARLKEEKIMSVCLAGNHDVIEDGSGRTILDVLRWVEGGPVITEPGVYTLGLRSKEVFNVVALPFTPLARHYDPVKVVDNLDLDEPPLGIFPELVIGHLNLKGITLGSESVDMPRGRDIFWPTEALRRRLPNALWLGGHYHTPQEFDGVKIVGSAVRLRFDEKDNSPGFMEIEI